MFEVSNFIVVPKNFRIKETPNTVVETKYLLYNMESPIPVIVSGEGCCGVATINEITWKDGKTIIDFTVYETTSAIKSAYWNLYQNSAAMNSDEEDYYNTPGAGSYSHNDESFSKPKPKRRPTKRGFLDSL